MKHLLKYLKDYKKETVLAPLFKMLEAIFELIVPLLMAVIIDEGIGGNNTTVIIQMGIILVLLTAVGSTSSITAQYFSAKSAVGFATQMKSALFSHIQKLSFTEMDEVGTSTLITRMTSDVNQVQNCVNMVLRLFLRSPFIVIGAMIMAFTIDVKSALIFVVAIPLLSIVVFGVMILCMPLYKKVQMKLDSLLQITKETLTGVRVIRAFHQEEEEVEKFESENANLIIIQKAAGKLSALMNPVTYLIVNTATIFLIWTGAWQVEGGAITQGEVVALVNYMSQILVELVKLANLIILITKGVACGNRLQNVFEMEPSLVSGAEDIKRDFVNESSDEMILSFKNVSLSYKNAGEESLTDISFDVMKGQTVGIIGGTGSGKTSIVNLIPRFYDATKGEVLFHGKDIREYNLDVLRERIGVVMQKSILFKGTIRENILWGKEDASEFEIEKALKDSQALEIVNGKDGGLDFLVSQGGKNLSGGQRQRLNIARALVRNPEILILDDSSSALDYATDAKLRMALKEMKEDTTILMVSQRTNAIRYADFILVVDDGHIVGKGTHDELLENCLVYQEIYYSQFPKEEKKEA
ncbi:MAG: ABC transporter ATP-binding protein [Eubacteriales bacterium]